MINKKFPFFLILIFTILLKNFSYAKIVEDQIFIGTTFSLKGENSSKSALYQNQFNKIVDQINTTGGIKVGTKIYKIKIISYDNESNSFKNNILLKRLILYDGVQFLISSDNFALSEEIIDLLEENQIVMIKSFNAISDYKELFEKLRTVNPKKIRDHLINK